MNTICSAYETPISRASANPQASFCLRFMFSIDCYAPLGSIISRDSWSGLEFVISIHQKVPEWEEDVVNLSFDSGK